MSKIKKGGYNTNNEFCEEDGKERENLRSKIEGEKTRGKGKCKESQKGEACDWRDRRMMNESVKAYRIPFCLNFQFVERGKRKRRLKWRNLRN